MLKKIELYLRLIKFSHTIFALPFAIIGFFVAYREVKPAWSLFILVLLAMVFARSAAMAFNRYVDRFIDKENPRTANREIPSNKISEKNALIFTIISSILFVVTTYFMNRLVFYLSPVALAIILGYSYTKRFCNMSHLILGLGLALAPLGAYLAVTGRFDLQPILYSFVVLFWVSGFDIIYALQDYEFDLTHGLKSIPVLMGKQKALKFSLFLHILSAIFVIVIGILFDYGVIYWIGSLIFIILLFYQHFLVKPDDLSKVNLAFFTTNGIASVIFAVFVVADLFLKL